MKLRRIGINLSPNYKDSDKLYASIVTSVDNFPAIKTFQDLLNFFNEGILKNVDWSDKDIICKDYVIDKGKLNIKHPEINDAKTAKPEDLIYLRVIQDLGLIVSMYVHDTFTFRHTLQDVSLLDYKIALNATKILDNKNKSLQAIDNYLVRSQATTLGRLWVKYYEGNESDDMKKQKLITKLFNKL